MFAFVSSSLTRPSQSVGLPAHSSSISSSISSSYSTFIGTPSSKRIASRLLSPCSCACPCSVPFSTIVAQTEGDIEVKKVVKEGEERMTKSIESVRQNLSTIRTGRANPAVLDRVTVTYYGTDTNIKQLASITTPNSTTIVVDAYDKKAIPDIERAIMQADLGMTPQNDGKLIRMIVPPLTQERRQDFVKVMKGLAEEGRVAIRNVRRDTVDKIKKMEKNSSISKDESKTQQDEVQKLTDKYIKQIDEMAKIKEKDIMTV